jgi:hypothetical protein
MDVGTFSGEESNDEDDGWEVNSIGADKDEIHEEVAETETPAADEIAMNQPCRRRAVRPKKSDIDEFVSSNDLTSKDKIKSRKM